jgi:hypothetical protein
MPPIAHRGYLYLRDEGRHEDDKSLRWIKLPCEGRSTTFHADTGIVGPSGPRWEFVWGFAFAPSGDQWITTGGTISPRSLVRRGTDGRYQIALIHGQTTFSGDLLGGRNDGLDFEGVLPTQDGGLLLAGNRGIYRLTGKRLTPIVGLKRTSQWVGGGSPPDPDPEGRGNWNLDPSHVLPVGSSSYLLGSDWEGVYLVERQPGSWTVRCLDEPLGPAVTF